VAFFDTEGTTGQALQGLNEDCQLIQVGQQADTTHMIM
jgi:hypothetical protein